MAGSWFSVLALVLAVGIAFDVWLGSTITWRRWLQAGLVCLGALLLAVIPSCFSAGPDGPDTEIPYRF